MHAGLISCDASVRSLLLVVLLTFLCPHFVAGFPRPWAMLGGFQPWSRLCPTLFTTAGSRLRPNHADSTCTAQPSLHPTVQVRAGLTQAMYLGGIIKEAFATSHAVMIATEGGVGVCDIDQPNTMTPLRLRGLLHIVALVMADRVALIVRVQWQSPLCSLNQALHYSGCCSGGQVCATLL